jgi:hypothetical protein
MNVTITRYSQETYPGGYDPDQGTPGILSIDGSDFACYTLELPWRDNDANFSRIPIGTYPAAYIHSPHFGRMLYQLENVSDRQNCEIHMGNFAGDTAKGYKSDVEGCTILGAHTGMLTPEGYAKPQLAVLDSVPTLDRFMAATQGQPLTFIYTDAA